MSAGFRAVGNGRENEHHCWPGDNVCTACKSAGDLTQRNCTCTRGMEPWGQPTLLSVCVPIFWCGPPPPPPPRWGSGTRQQVQGCSVGLASLAVYAGSDAIFNGKDGRAILAWFILSCYHACVGKTAYERRRSKGHLTHTPKKHGKNTLKLHLFSLPLWLYWTREEMGTQGEVYWKDDLVESKGKIICPKAYSYLLKVVTFLPLSSYLSPVGYFASTL